MTVSRTRGFLYSLARLLGDYQAVKRGRVGNRAVAQAKNSSMRQEAR
ncbi:MAG TPA: hypothetical protein VEM59_10860 [Acidimicrobiia bacterium]|nr:hypothetical protein [Acidimicrobiia bacterium]